MSVATASQSSSVRYRAHVGDLEVDLLDGEVRDRAGCVTARLTVLERELLGYMLARAREVVTRADLLSHVWHYHPASRTRAVDLTIARLRQKVEPNPGLPEVLRTVHGQGYVLDPVPVRHPARLTERLALVEHRLAQLESTLRALVGAEPA